ncbi:hypothetical protein PF004_g876 [Phytophthora fragariae]|uniref:Uncharacterized protein n=1 Tax=Phytophthora fragariae TaxID=53985 RepID=A0A6A3MC93_9STRA|nr:hypothetical protein PF011_g875 [Phytophthora fragariae]KAE9254780.1 hypothetical protein PF004_g876 [Phytophthora fragariae]
MVLPGLVGLLVAQKQRHEESPPMRNWTCCRSRPRPNRSSSNRTDVEMEGEQQDEEDAEVEGGQDAAALGQAELRHLLGARELDEDPGLQPRRGLARRALTPGEKSAGETMPTTTAGAVSKKPEVKADKKMSSMDFEWSNMSFVTALPKKQSIVRCIT